MVSQFRDFLNTSPRFQELRESLPFRAGGSRTRGAAARRSQAMANNLPAAEGEGFDDEMADEENDFEGLDGSEMAVDVQAQNQHPPDPFMGQPFAGPAPFGGPQPPPPYAQHSIPIPPPVPSASQQPFPAHYMPSQPGPMGPFAFTSFVVGHEPAVMPSPFSTHSHTQASTAGAPGPAPGASTASVQPPYHHGSLGE